MNQCWATGRQEICYGEDPGKNIRVLSYKGLQNKSENLIFLIHIKELVEMVMEIGFFQFYNTPTRFESRLRLSLNI